MADNVYDAIVIGSGISGGWAAKELTQKIAIGQHIQTVTISTDTGPFFGVTIPGSNIFIADRPVHAVPVFYVCFEI